MPKPSSKLTNKADVIRGYSDWKKNIPHQTTIYIIVDYSIAEPFMDQILPYVCETAIDTVRHTVTGTDRILLKWKPLLFPDDVHPSVENRIDSIMNVIDIFTYDEILVEIQKPEWQSEDIL